MREKFCPLTDAQWQFIEKVVADGRKRKTNLRFVIDAIRLIAQTGLQWRNLPNTYPAWQTVYYYFDKWTKNRTIETLLQMSNQQRRSQAQRSPTPTRVAIDSQSVRKGLFVSQNTVIDGYKQVNGRKRHIAVDSLGLLMSVHITCANAHDGQVGIELFPILSKSAPNLVLICADSAYQGDFQTNAAYCKYTVEIAQKPESDKGFVPQKGRWQRGRPCGRAFFCLG